MGPLKCFHFLILLHVLVSISSLAFDDVVGYDLIMSPHGSPTIARILQTVGGRHGFDEEVRNAIIEASSLRNGISASLIEFKVGKTIVAKICFADGICWAAKMLEIHPQLDAIKYGIGALILIEHYCPSVPIDKFKGCGQRKLLYCFTEWMEGKTLVDRVFGVSGNIPARGTFSIPENLVPSLAAFVYNLSTCPIPRNLSKKHLNCPLIITVSKVQLDDFSFVGIGPRNNTALEAMNSTTWVKRQFIAWHLIYKGTGLSMKPFDGLDKMILLSWICQKFTDDQPFVLHYWDLRMPNILIDDDDNLIA